MIKKKKQMKINCGIFLTLSLLLLSMGLISIPTHYSQTEVKKNEKKPLNLSDNNPQYIDSVTIHYGSDGSGLLDNTYVDDTNYKQYNAEYYEYPFYSYGIGVEFNFNPTLSGGDYLLDLHIETSVGSPPVALYINGQQFFLSNTIELHDEVINNVNSIEISASDFQTDFNVKIFYLMIEPIESSPETWYESFEKYEIGQFPNEEWTPTYMGEYTEVVMASTHNVGMEGKVLRMYSQGYYYKPGIERSTSFSGPINNGESFYLKFRAQINKQAAGGDAFIQLVGDGATRFFQLMISTKDEYGVIAVSIFDEQNIILGYTIANQVYDFDIFFVKDLETDDLKYYIYINQDLALFYENDIGDLYPNTILISYENVDGGPGELFIDNFFFGFIDNYITSKYTVIVIDPIYYLYVPSYMSGVDHVNKLGMSFRYYEIHNEIVTVKVNLGLKIPFVMGVFTPIFSDVAPLNEYTPERYEFDVSTSLSSEEDVYVYYNLTLEISNITFYLPGIDPQTGVSEVEGIFILDITRTKITSATISAFQNMGYEIPQDYYDCSRSGNAQIYDHRTIESAVYGAQTYHYPIEDQVMDLTRTISGGASFGLFEIFTLAVSITVSFIHEYKAEARLDVDWDSDTVETTKIQYDLYAPPDGDYSKYTDLKPFSVDQVLYHKPSQATGLTATGGKNRIDLSWTANAEADIEYYKIYRNGVEIATTTSTNFADSGLEDATTYSYKVAAVNIYGEEGPSSIVAQATTDPPEEAPGFTEWLILSTLALGIAVVLYRFHFKVKKTIKK